MSELRVCWLTIQFPNMYDTLVYINRGSWLLLESGSLYTQLIPRAAHVHGGVFASVLVESGLMKKQLESAYA